MIRRPEWAARLTVLLLFLLLGGTGCAAASRAAIPPTATLAAATVTLPTLLPSPTAVPPAATATPSPPPTAPPATAVAPAALLPYDGPDCGVLLPILPAADPAPVASEIDPAAAAGLLALAPEAAQEALGYLLDYPAAVGLAAFRPGEEAAGAYLNAEVPMPLASVVKVVILAAYAEAVGDGRLDPTSTVPLADLEAFYLPTVDLNAHSRAVATLTEEGRVFGEPPAVLLDAVAEMMMTYSSNAASDYLQALLGQELIEQTAVDLGLDSQTAPCPFVGQFLAMSNHTRGTQDDAAAVAAYIAAPERYGREVMALTAAFSSDSEFREAAIDWRRTTRRPSGRVQRSFTDALNAHGSAAEYADLMARLAQNGLGSGEASFTARRLLEWPNQFAVNQEVFSNVGYKGGTLPGVLTAAYYAYPLSDGRAVVAAIFFRDLDGATYRAWRNNQSHDELARWLLYEPRAIPLLREALGGGG